MLPQGKRGSPRVLIWGYYGCHNAGDDILLGNLCALIREFCPDAALSANAADFSFVSSLGVTPLQTAARRGGKILSLLALIWGRVRAIAANDLVIFGGGTQIFDRGKNRWYPIMTFALVLAANRLFLRRPVLHFGIGMGPVETGAGRFFSRVVIRCSDLFVVRDRDSYRLLERLGCPENKLLLSCDLAYFLPAPSGDRARGEGRALKVALSAFPYYQYVERDPVANQNLLQAAIGFSDKFLQGHPEAEIHLVAMQGAFANDDHEFGLRIREASSCRDRIHCHPYQGDIERLHALMAGMDLAVGMRLHFNILCYLHGVPVVPLAYQQKVASEAARFADRELVLDARSVTGEGIYQAVATLMERRAATLARYREALAELASLAQQGREALQDFLASQRRL